MLKRCLQENTLNPHSTIYVCMEGEVKMTNLEKMNDLVGTNADKEQIINWAYMNRVLFDSLFLEKEFEVMEKSVMAFVETDPYS